MARPRNRPHNLSIIIPAAGAGRRMKSHGPKPLIELPASGSPGRGHETVIGRQIRVLREVFPGAEIVVVVGHEAERVIRSLPAGVKVVENELYADTNVIRSVGMGLRVASHGSVLVVYGDLVFNAQAVGWASRCGSAVLADSRGLIDRDEVGLTAVDGKVTHFSYGLLTKWAQVAYLTGRELEIFRKIAWNTDRRRSLGFEALNELIEGGGHLRVAEPAGMWIAEIDCTKDIEKVRSHQHAYSL